MSLFKKQEVVEPIQIKEPKRYETPPKVRNPETKIVPVFDSPLVKSNIEEPKVKVKGSWEGKSIEFLDYVVGEEHGTHQEDEPLQKSGAERPLPQNDER